MSSIARRPFTLDRIVRIIIGIIIVVSVGLIINRLSGVLLPFLIAWLIAYLMYPLLSFFQYRLKLKNRILAIAATLITVFGILSLACYLLIPPIIAEAQRAGVIISQFITNTNGSWNLPPALMQSIQKFLSNINVQNLLNFQNIEGLVKEFLPRMWDVISGAGGIILNVVIVFFVLLYLIFILKDYEKISKGWINLVPKQYRAFVLQVGEDLKNGMNHYFRGQALISLIVGILFAIGFSIIGLPLGIIFGLFVGLLSMIPYLHTFAIIPAVMLGAIKASDYNQNFLWVVISILAVFIIVQLIEEILLTPKIMGNATGLNPAIILLSLSIWGSLFGIIGMILALPMTTLIISYYERFIIAGSFIENLTTEPKIEGTPTLAEEKEVEDKSKQES